MVPGQTWLSPDNFRTYLADFFLLPSLAFKFYETFEFARDFTGRNAKTVASGTAVSVEGRGTGWLLCGMLKNCDLMRGGSFRAAD